MIVMHRVGLVSYQEKHHLPKHMITFTSHMEMQIFISLLKLTGLSLCEFRTGQGLEKVG